ncbi:hypothetical protein Ea357_053 [Erwinia phage Ea35-70]|uniref:Uncharacterized protein n=1 Tax=Erwinia phage Ea35-70 TaxID=1429768 RepID=W6AR50_9CAUD|nr:hypothetical protein Ea357_053 [Erwinia phage Ea35-70]AHI60203.1 hypothetical protein Ea357_053 [Erwinia phage Ea35-70]
MAEVIKRLPGMNHHPAHPGIWVPFESYRLKDYYDIKLKTGEVYKCWYPNATAWSPRGELVEGQPGRVEDDDVVEIRLLPDEEITDRYWFKGEDRLKRNIDFFGDVLPEVITAEDGTVTFKPITRRVFDELVTSSWDGEKAIWLREDELSVEELKTRLWSEKGDIDPDSILGRSFTTYLTLLCTQAKYELELLEVPWKGSTFYMNLMSPTDYQREACMNAVVKLEELAAQKQAEGPLPSTPYRGVTAAGRAAQRAVVTAAAHTLVSALDRKAIAGAKHMKGDRFVTKGEARVVDGQKLTGKQLRKLQKKQRRAERGTVE